MPEKAWTTDERGTLSTRRAESHAPGESVAERATQAHGIVSGAGSVQHVQAHRLDVAMARGSNGRRLNVRCECMMGCRGTGRFWNYDTLGTVSTLPEAIALWREHTDG